MFGTLATIILGTYATIKGFSDMADDAESRSKAIENGELIYYDSKNKQRHVKTKEIVTSYFSDSFHRGHDTLVGVNTNKVYMDYTEAGVRAINAINKEKGKKYIWKEYVDQSGRDSIWYPFDVVEKKPYRLIITRTYGMDGKRYYEIQYLKKNGNFMDPDYDMPKKIFETLKEAEPYNYGPFYKRKSKSFALAYRSNDYNGF